MAVAHESYDAFRNQVNENAYDVDNTYGAQCWDGVSLLWWNVTSNHRGFDTGGTGRAKGGWQVESARNVNAGTEFELITDKTKIKRGDILVFSLGDTGHVGFADQDYNGTNDISVFGQNQNYVPSFSTYTYSLSTFIGAFRYKVWSDHEPPVVSAYIDISDISPDGFTLTVDAGDNVGITDVYAVITPLYSAVSNAPSQPIKGTYNKEKETATIRVDLTKNICGISEYYTCKCYVNDRNGNGPTTVSTKIPFSICKLDSDVTDYMNCMKDVDVYAFPEYNDDLIVDHYPSQTYVNSMGSLVHGAETWHRIDRNRWINDKDLAVRGDPLAVEHRPDLWEDMPKTRYVYYRYDAEWNEKYIEATDIIQAAGKIAYGRTYSVSDPETIATVGTSEYFVPRENSDYEIAFKEVGDDPELCIIGYLGSGGSVVIPEKIGDYTVTEIESNAFEDIETITDISFPSSIKKIGSYAFSGCKGLTKLTIPSTVMDVGSYAFLNCTGIKKLELPETTYFNSGAFVGCTGLREITMPVDLDNVLIFSEDIIGVETINYLKGKTGEMPDRSTSSGSNNYKTSIEYYSRNFLQRLNFEEGITHIGDYAYYGNECALNEIHLPSTLESIGNAAFYENATLTSIEIPEGVSSIGDFAFSKSGLTEVTIPEGIELIPYACFKDCTELEEVSLPASLTNISESAFENCTSLSGLPSIPEDASVTIASYVFKGCTGIANLTIPPMVSSIGRSAFQGCTGLQTLVLPQEAVYDSHVFSGCTDLREVTMPVDLANGSIFSSDITNVETIHYLKGESGIMLNRTTSSGNDNYEYCLEYYSRENLKHLYFEEGITHIGSYAYYGSEYTFNEIHLPSTLESIGNAAFYENAALTSIEIPEGVSSIGNFAFSKSGLTEVTIPKAITTLSDSCFKDCASLKEVHTTQDCNLSFVYTTTFSGCPDDLTFFGYTGSYVESYANDSGYHFVALDEDWTAEMILPAGLKTIEEEAFENGAFHSVEIPEGTLAIGNRVFAGCGNLERILIPASVEMIAPDAFEGITYLVVYCPADSYAQQYARSQGFLVVEK